MTIAMTGRNHLPMRERRSGATRWYSRGDITYDSFACVLTQQLELCARDNTRAVRIVHFATLMYS